jgi:hypothetical protein
MPGVALRALVSLAREIEQLLPAARNKIVTSFRLLGFVNIFQPGSRR